MATAALLRRALTPIAPPVCFGCGAGAGRVEPLCPACRRSLAWLPSGPVALGEGDDSLPAWAPLAYRAGSRALVRALKFRGAVAVADAMAAQIAASAPDLVWQGAGLVPVPLHPARRRRRGFNQAVRLAAALAERTGATVVDCLERRGPRGTQVGRDRSERLAALEGAFVIRSPPPPSALVVDDVLTTGATALACARALRGAGVEVVGAVAYARTPGR